ncbi:MAG: hypothetical protein AAGI23_00980 [Bacteroidota bacterium]
MIKQITFLFSFLFVFSFSLQAQEVELREGNFTREEASRPGIQATLPTDTKEVKKAFSDFMDDRYDVNMKGIGFLTNKDELTAEKVNITTLSDETIDLYARVVETSNGNGTQMTLFGAKGYDIYIDSDRSYSEFQNLRNLMVEFLDSYLVDQYTERVEEAREEVADLQDDRSDVQDDIESSEEDIQKSKERIKELEAEIAEMKTELDNKRSNIKSAEEKYEARMNELQKIKRELDSISRSYRK